MFTSHAIRNAFQSTTCMLLAAVIVSVSLTMGAVGVQTMEQNAIAVLASTHE